jgi:hypothetical protein
MLESKKTRTATQVMQEFSLVFMRGSSSSLSGMIRDLKKSDQEEALRLQAELARLTRVMYPR